MDAWMEHLKKYNLVKMHEYAQQARYRVRVANGYEFHLEYEGGLGYYQNNLALKRFRDTEDGRKEATEFIKRAINDHQL